MKTTYLVVDWNNALWGRGSTVEEAKSAGGIRLSNKNVEVHVFPFESEPYVDNLGWIRWNGDGPLD